MKIVFYNHTGLVSGAERMLLLLLADLPRDRFDIALVCPPEGTLELEAKALGLPTYATRSITARFTYNPFKVVGYLFSVARAMLDTRRTFISLDPELVHANTVRAGIVATIATLGTGVPVIWHIHDMLPDHAITRAVRSLAYSSRRIHLVACSKAAADTLKPTKQRDNPVEVIPNGLPMDVVLATPEDVLAKKNELAIASSTFVVGIVGMITPRKGQLRLIQAFAKLREVAPDSLLLIIGSAIFNKDHVYLYSLQEEVKHLHLGTSVRFLGQRSDVSILLQVMDLLVLNSVTEPFSLAILEAMRAGKAVLATDCGGPREVIEHGITGEIIPTEDTASLANAMIRLQDDDALRVRYGLAAREKVCANFTKEKYVARWIRRYELIQASSSSLQALAIPNEGSSLQVGGGG